MTGFIPVVARLILAAFAAVLPMMAVAQVEPIGIVIMHGKGGSPTAAHIVAFVQQLETRGFLVANLDMPWSGKRNYDVTVSRGEEEVESAVAELRSKGAKSIFVAGHSQGGAFAVHLAGRQRANGVIAIAPGGNVAGAVYRQKVDPSLVLARKLVAEGKGGESAQLMDYEASRGLYPVISLPTAYVTWFDPEGAMNFYRAVKAVDPKVPVLMVAPTRDHPSLVRMNPREFGNLPRNPSSRLYEPNADHYTVLLASVDEIERWTREVTNAPNR